MQALISAALDRSRTVTLLFIILIVAGIAAFMSIAKESSPDITIPMVYVSTSLDGISPEDADRLLVTPLEQELKSVEGIKKMTSTASEGHASVMLEFFADADIDAAIDDTREKTDRAKGNLPKDATEPSVTEVNMAKFPILLMSISGNIDDRILYKVAENLQERIEGINGVLEAEISGNREEIAEIIIDPTLMASYNISHTELYSLVSRNNQLVTAGNMDTGAGRFSVKIPGLIESEEDILDLPIKVDGDTVVRFKDIAFGKRQFKDYQMLSRVNGQPAVTLSIKKRVGKNIIEVTDAAKALIEELQPNWPEGIEVSYSQDQSKDIKTTLTDLYNNVLFASVLVIIVMLWFMGIRSALLVGIAIPTSFLAGILILQLLGYTLNMVVLFALILSLGMLVDGAIVVTEYADRKMSEGHSRKVAYREAAIRMSWPIISSTATTLAVFLPLLFWQGLVGEFMKFLPITVMITLGSSLVVALIIIPTFGFMFGKAEKVSDKEKASLDAANSGDIENIKGLTGAYVRFLKKMLIQPFAVLTIVVCSMMMLILAYGQFGKGVEFFPNIDSEFGNVLVKARGNLSLEERDILVRQVEDLALLVPEVKSVTTTVTASTLGQASEDTIGRLSLEFIDWTLREGGVTILNNLVDQASLIPGIVVEKEVPAQGPTSGKAIQISLTAGNMADLYSATDLLEAKFNEFDDLVDISTTRPLPGIEWQLDVDREAASRFGADLNMVGSSIRMITSGLKIGSYRPDDADDELDIRIRYPYDGRNLDELDAVTVTAMGQQVPISNFVDRTHQLKQGSIFRTDGNLSLQVEANLKEGVVPSDAIAMLTAELEKMRDEGTWPANVYPKFIGDQQEQEDSMIFLATAFIAALVFMFIILVTQFNSMYQSMLILSAIFLAIGGVFLGLMVTAVPFGVVMCGVGIIALAGIVVNNNIVLIDTYNYIKAQGIEPTDAILRTCAQRLRPVLLTTITTILGLIPMVTQMNINVFDQSIVFGAPSSQWWTQLSTAIAGGLAFATVLTLVLTPCLLIIKDSRDFKRKQKKARLTEALETNL
jgi:multidrug efflux pump